MLQFWGNSQVFFGKVFLFKVLLGMLLFVIIIKIKVIGKLCRGNFIVDWIFNFFEDVRGNFEFIMFK